ncbi:MAG TPA: VWA domain-containing protein [Isosphaeraceae bacterium]|jgi:Ca-activated chloride channel family protein
MRLAEPAWLVLLALMPLPWLGERMRPRIAWPSLRGFRRVPAAGAGWPRHLPAALRGLALGALAVALARPQSVGGQTRVAGRGVAIVVALDQSTSMTAVDFPAEAGLLSRLEAARRTFSRFVQGRPDDLIGLVAFANYPDLACPPTLDHAFLLEAVRTLRTARPGEDGTNIGDAIAWALDALRDSPPKQKVLVLLTDGVNSPGVPRPLDPEAGAQLARDLGVTLHTIAVGRPGGIVRAREPITGLPIPAEVEGPDLALLDRLARLGGGRAFVAADARGLDAVFRAIDELEKSPVRGTVRTRYREWYTPWVGLAVALLVLDRLLAAGRLRRLP